MKNKLLIALGLSVAMSSTFAVTDANTQANQAATQAVQTTATQTATQTAQTVSQTSGDAAQTVQGAATQAATTAAAVHQAASTTVNLDSDLNKTSYAVGVTLGQNFKKQDLSIDPTAFVQGFQAGLGDNKSQMTQAQIEKTMQDFQQHLIAQQAKVAAKAAETNSSASQQFLAANKAKPGVKSLADGLQYKVITPGTGGIPSKTSTVTVDYEGKLVSGEVFDSSYKRGQPATFPLTDVIKGWQEALSQMKSGATWEIYVPSDLAYGATGIPGHIGPNEALIFKVHLISFKGDSDASASSSSAKPATATVQQHS